jgi:hypothetical protein
MIRHKEPVLNTVSIDETLFYNPIHCNFQSAKVTARDKQFVSRILDSIYQACPSDSLIEFELKSETELFVCQFKLNTASDLDIALSEQANNLDELMTKVLKATKAKLSEWKRVRFDQ